ncbi:MAG: imidazole glycerol phosphate synthase subunit HisF [Elusimicrobia bacterium]|nr:imidazole glycerol phosphate synthase subunit HisF [Elusimicrobiota bacterium]
MIVKVIPCLDVNKGRVVKGINFVNLRDAGDPVEIAARYNEEGADEIVFLDITATTENRATTIDMVKRVANKVSVPFCVGGGVKNADDIAALLDVGASKVGVNSATVTNPQIISEAAKRFGSKHIVCAVDVKKMSDGWNVYTRGGTLDTGINALEWLKEVENLGAGEILLTSLDADGTKDGYDLGILKKAKELLNIPITASGGAGKLEHFAQAAQAGASAVLAASLFHFRELTIPQVKEYLKSKGFKTS